MPPVLILTTMVRNESKALPRLLRSVAQVVTHVALTDTGSTDSTIEVAETVCAELGLTLDVHVVPWQDFGFNRTENLKHGRKVAASTPTPADCYLLLLDADMEVPAGVRPLSAYPSLGVLAQSDGQAVWWNTRIIKSDIDASYVGRTHEYLSHGQSPTKLEWFEIIDHCDGGCRSDKFERDERLLRLDLAEKNDPRSMFYLAQTLKTLGKTAEAVELFDRRAQFEDFPEEAWVARMEASRCLSGPEADMRALEAFFTRPFRAEPLAEMAVRAAEAGKHKLALGLAVLGKSIPYPKSELLYMSDYAYRWAFARVEMISSFYVGDSETGRKACDYLELTKGSPHAREAVNNAVFYTKKLEAIKGPLPVHNLKGFVPANPSLRKISGGWLAVIRNVNYRIYVDGVWYPLIGGGVASKDTPVITRNLVVWYDDNFNNVRQLELTHPKGINTEATIVGFEDMRIISADENRLVVCAVRCDNTPKQQPDLWEATWDLVTGKLVESHRISDGSRCEKNWLFTGDGYVYSHGPLTFVDGRGAFVRKLNHSLDLSQFRGSAPPIPYKNGHLYLVHEVTDRGPRVYMHRFVWASKDWSQLTVGPLFRFGDQPCIEYCLSINAIPGGIILACSYDDREVYTLSVTEQTVDRALAEGSKT